MSSTDRVRFCGNCGQEIVKGNKFCTNCGAMIPSHNEPTAPQTPDSNSCEAVNNNTADLPETAVVSRDESRRELPTEEKTIGETEQFRTKPVETSKAKTKKKSIIIMAASLIVISALVGAGAVYNLKTSKLPIESAVDGASEAVEVLAADDAVLPIAPTLEGFREEVEALGADAAIYKDREYHLPMDPFECPLTIEELDDGTRYSNIIDGHTVRDTDLYNNGTQRAIRYYDDGSILSEVYTELGQNGYVGKIYIPGTDYYFELQAGPSYISRLEKKKISTDSGEDITCSSAVLIESKWIDSYSDVAYEEEDLPEGSAPLAEFYAGYDENGEMIYWAYTNENGDREICYGVDEYSIITTLYQDGSIGLYIAVGAAPVIFPVDYVFVVQDDTCVFKDSTDYYRGENSCFHYMGSDGRFSLYSGDDLVLHTACNFQCYCFMPGHPDQTTIYNHGTVKSGTVDEDWNFITETFYVENGEIRVVEYDILRTILNTTIYYEDGTIDYCKTQMTPYRDYYHFTPDGEISFHKKDSSQNEIAVLYFDEAGEVSQYTKSTYDDNHNLLTVETYDGQGSLLEYVVNTLNEDGSVQETRTYNAEGLVDTEQSD